MGLTPLTHMLSFQILETNTKSGNVGPTLNLLNLINARDSPPSDISDPSQTWRCPLSASSIFV